MTNDAPILKDEKRRVEKLTFHFDNPGDVSIEVPVMTCEKTDKKFFHPKDVDAVLKALDTEYERVHKILKSKN